MKKTIYLSWLFFLCFVQIAYAQSGNHTPKTKVAAPDKSGSILNSFPNLQGRMPTVKVLKPQNNASLRKEIQMFPSPTDNQNRFVIKLPRKSNEENYRVGIIVGKNMTTDICNTFIISSAVEEKIIEGWGYSYYVLNEMIGVATKMACLNNKKQTKFVHTPTKLLRYNSKLPIVLYVPKDAIVKYTIWAGNQPVVATQLN